MKWVSSKCGLFAVLSALLFTALLTGSTANALPPPIPTIPELIAGDVTDTTGTCDIKNYSNLVSGFYSTDTNNPLSYKNTFQYSTYQSQLDTWQSNLSSRLDDGYGWAFLVTSSSEGVDPIANPSGWDSASKMVRIVYFDSDATLTVEDTGTAYRIATDKGNFKYTDFEWESWNSCRYTTWRKNQSSTYLPLAGSKIFILNAMDVIYPNDYPGEPIPSIYTPPRKPDFNYTVSSSGLLKVDYLDNYETKPNGAFEVQLMQTGDEWDMPLTQVDERVIEPAYTMGYEYELSNSGYYHIGISYDDQAELVGVALQFYWNGFSAINGTTIGGCYDDDGVCNPELQNTHPIVRLLNSLPVNDYGLQELVRAPIQFFASLPEQAENCTPITLNLPYANAPVTFPCLTTTVFQPHFPTLLTIWQTVITGIVAYGISIKIFATVKNVQTPDNDRIEVAKL